MEYKFSKGIEMLCKITDWLTYNEIGKLTHCLLGPMVAVFLPLWLLYLTDSIALTLGVAVVASGLLAASILVLRDQYP